MDIGDAVVVVGGSLAGLSTAQALRLEGYRGAITIVSEETHWPPYDRPPLSKQVLVGALEPDRVRLRAPDDPGTDVVTGRRAEHLDLAGRSVTLDDGTRLAYGALVIATGATPRRLPGAEGLANVHMLRTVDESLTLRGALGRARRVAVVGAGFIGCEVASACRSLGIDVTVVDQLPAPLAPLGPAVGEILAAEMRAEGVDLRLGTAVAGFERRDGAVTGVRVGEGTVVETDVVVVGIGVTPNIAWLDASGLTVDDGVVCDETGLAAGGGGRVAAVGDVARWVHPRYGPMRIEHWTNAREQAAHVAKVLAHGADTAGAFAPVPYFWSDQFGRKLQFVGVCRDGDEVRIVEGAVDQGRWVAAYGRDGVTVAALCVGWPARLAPWHALVAGGAPFPPPLS